MAGRSEGHMFSSLTQTVFWNNWSRTRPSHCFWISRNKNYFMFLKRFIKKTILYYHVLHYTNSLITYLQQTFVLSSTPLISLISRFCFLCRTPYSCFSPSFSFFKFFLVFLTSAGLLWMCTVLSIWQLIWRYGSIKV